MHISQIIPFLDENKKNTKIHCAIGDTKNGSSKLEPFFIFSKGKFKEWQDRQRQKNFEKNIYCH